MVRKKRKLFVVLLIVLFFLVGILGFAQGNADKGAEAGGTNYWIPIITLLVGIIIGGGGVLGLIKFLKRFRDTTRKKLAELEAEDDYNKKKQNRVFRTAGQVYRAALQEELGTIHVPGSPDIDNRAVKLDAAFVPLHISHTWRSDRRFDELKAPGGPGKGKSERHLTPGDHGMSDSERHLSPEEAMRLAFKNYKLLLIIGDPGSGKTTLLKYYAVKFLEKQQRHFGLPAGTLPIYFPLRELEFDERGEPLSLPANLGRWAERRLLAVTEEQFRGFLQGSRTLVLLDGLDEISSKEKRRKACAWIKHMCAGLGEAHFVVTSRATGYRKLDGIELDCEHLRADILDFSVKQQEEFLQRWFRAVYSAEVNPGDRSEAEWRQQQEEKADRQSQKIIKFLQEKDNKAVRELAAVPMLLQITALIWKEKEYLPRTRGELFDAALNYLLEHRDRHRGIEPLLPARDSRRVLAPAALWMQEELEKDEVLKEKMRAKMQPHLNTLPEQYRFPAQEFCDFLRDRAGILAEYDRDYFIFRHKSFREFLSALQLREDCHQPRRIETLVSHFNEDWWEEPLRFFMSDSNDQIFDEFMDLFFGSQVSGSLDANRQTLLQNLILDAPQRRIDSLRKHLLSGKLDANRARYALDCLKTIAGKEVLDVVNAFIEQQQDKKEIDDPLLGLARDIAAQLEAKLNPGSIKIQLEKIEANVEIGAEVKKVEEVALFDETPGSFRNPFEENVEYIEIPGGSYKYSVSGKIETVPGFYLCKYPVTNKNYRCFISFLEGREKDLEKLISPAEFTEKLLKFASTVKEYVDYLGKKPGAWPEKLRSRYDEDKRFKEDEKPVVGVSWFAARAYCFWLSCLEASRTSRAALDDIKKLSAIYRLPAEVEWEWAAGGNPDGSVRQYPWPPEQGPPSPELANYERNVGATTPVGRYPKGATPTGLMDMAGNVWEWMENKVEEDKPYRALRGGSWYNYASPLCCSARCDYFPDYWYVDLGFRVLRSQS